LALIYAISSFTEPTGTDGPTVIEVEVVAKIEAATRSLAAS
jgi:hypothetical protein